MNHAEASETEQWRAQDREIQGLVDGRQRRAQAVVDVAESAKKRAEQRGTHPLDDLLELYLKVAGEAAKQMVADSLYYVKTELDLVRPLRSGGIGFDALSRWPLPIRL